MTLFLAQVLSIYLLVVGIALFLNPGRFRMIYKAFFENEGMLLLAGVVALLFGAFIVSAHNYWIFGWPVILTLIGYWGIIKGAGILILPGFVDFFKPMVNVSDSLYRIMGIIVGLVGLFLFYQGWLV